MISALLLSTVASNMPADFVVPPEIGPGFRPLLRGLYMAFVSIGFMEYLISIVTALVHVMYTEPLPDAKTALISG